MQGQKILHNNIRTRAHLGHGPWAGGLLQDGDGGGRREVDAQPEQAVGRVDRCEVKVLHALRRARAATAACAGQATRDAVLQRDAPGPLPLQKGKNNFLNVWYCSAMPPERSLCKRGKTKYDVWYCSAMPPERSLCKRGNTKYDVRYWSEVLPDRSLCTEAGSIDWLDRCDAFNSQG